jgi:hypothetical protein
MHIAIDNFWLLTVTGPPMPNDLTSSELEKSVTRKADVMKWLSRSFEAVKMARASLKSGDLDRKVKMEGRDTTVDGIYLRIIIHANERLSARDAPTPQREVAPA